MTGHIYTKKKGDGDDDAERVIMKQGDASSSTTSVSDREEERKRARFRETMVAFFSSTKFHVAIVILVIISSLLVVTQLLIDLKIFEFGDERNKAASRILYCVFIAIAGLFVLENALKCIAFGTKFVKEVMELFDFVVVVVAFSLGLALAGKESGVGLLLMLRFWRVSRILNSIIASVKEDCERKLRKERRSRVALEREIAKLREYCVLQEYEISALKLALREANVDEPLALRIPTSSPQTLRVIAEINDYEETLNELVLGEIELHKFRGHDV